jgi:uncharacterized protein (DUF433 family)
MFIAPVALDVPLRTDDNGVIRVSNTRVTLHTLINAHKRGDTPEGIHEGFPTVPLADIYAVIAYYLAHTSQIDTYMAEEDAEGERMRQLWETRHPAPTRAELLARLDAQRKGL